MHERLEAAARKLKPSADSMSQCGSHLEHVRGPHPQYHPPCVLDSKRNDITALAKSIEHAIGVPPDGSDRNAHDGQDERSRLRDYADANVILCTECLAR